MKTNQKYAFVQDINGVVLSPTKEEKAWYLIRRGRAKLIEKDPMVIQLQREQENTDLSKFNFPEWIYAKSTVTDTVYQTEESNSPVMICTTDFKDSSISKIPEDSTNIDSAITDATNNDTENVLIDNEIYLNDVTCYIKLPTSVRPVLVISKNLLKNTTTEDSTTNTNTTTNSDNTIGN